MDCPSDGTTSAACGDGGSSCSLSKTGCDEWGGDMDHPTATSADSEGDGIAKGDGTAADTTTSAEL